MTEIKAKKVLFKNRDGEHLIPYVGDTAVLKTGDTMTGALNIQTQVATPFALRNTNTNTEAYSEIQFQDHTGHRRNTIRSQYFYDDSGAIQKSTFTIGSNKLDGSAPTGLILTCDSGNLYFEFPRCTTKATTTSSASNGKVAVVVQNYKNGTSWYRVYSDGWIEQGGIISVPEFTTSINRTVTLLKKFSDTNYTVLSQLISGGTNWAVVQGSNIGKQTGQFNINLYTSGGSVTIASQSRQWYACGY